MASIKASYFKIGIFSLIAITIVIAVLVVYGAGIWQQKKVYFETYIDESVQGLSVGSPVKYRGVDIGKVEKITFVSAVYHIEVTDKEYTELANDVLVVMSVTPDALKTINQQSFGIEAKIESGLRLTLTRQTLTGIAYLELDYPKSPSPLIKVPWEPRYVYIPSSKSLLGNVTDKIERILKDISDLNLVNLQDKLDTLLTNLNDKVQAVDTALISDKVVDTLDGINLAAKDADKLIRLASDKVEYIDTKELNAKLVRLMDDFQTVAKKVAVLSDNVNEFFYLPEGQEKVGLYAITDKAYGVLDQLDSTIYEVGPEMYSLLESLDDTIKNIDSLVRDFRQNPSQLIFSSEPKKAEVYK